VLQSKGIAPTGSKVETVALTEKQLIAQKKLAIKRASDVKAN